MQSTNEGRTTIIMDKTMPAHTPLTDQRGSARETLIKSLSDFSLEFLYIARNNLTRIASYLRKVMTKLCIKILVKTDSAI